MFRPTRPGVLAALVVSVALALTGCVDGAPTPTETPAAAPASPTPTPEVVDPLSTVVAAIARPQSLELRDDSGAIVASLDYLGDADEALSALETVFGTGPQSEAYPGNSHFTPGVVHRWGGMELWEPQYDGDVANMPRSYYKPSFFVRFTASTSGEVALATDDGRRVGDAWAELLAAPALQTNPSGCSGPYLDHVEIPATDSDGNEYEQPVAVTFRASEDEATIARVDAPVEVHEECA